MAAPNPTPLIGISACARPSQGEGGGRGIVHGVSEQYVRAICDAAFGAPVLLPAIGAATDFATLVDSLDGLLLTGSPSNVAPERYAGAPARPGSPSDQRRDATTLPLIERALEAGLPLLALCRGHQELNVALGGTLHPHVHELPGKRDHRSPPGPINRERYGPRHGVTLTPGGVLAGLAGATEIVVNSLHAQAIDRLAARLEVEARAPDGVIEAVRVRGASALALGLQWHPEWGAIDWGAEEDGCPPDPLSRAIFAAFGAAARDRARARSLPPRSRNGD